MSFNQYGRPHQYGPPPGAYGGYERGNAPPNMAAPMGLGAPPTISAAPGIAPPGVQYHNLPQTTRTGGFPANFQPPSSMANINFSAPVIRLGTTSARGGGGPSNSEPERSLGGHGRPGLGMDRGGADTRAVKEIVPAVVPPTTDEKLRTVFVHQIPESLNSSNAIEKLLGSVGKLRRWDPLDSVLDDHKGSKFGFALYEDVESLYAAIKLLHEKEVEVPVKRQPIAPESPQDDEFEGIEKTTLQITVDPSSLKYIESYEEKSSEGDEKEKKDQRMAASESALKKAVKELFYPLPGAVADADGDIPMKDDENGDDVEVVNITLAQEDELADIPAEMREVVSQEITAFRERSTMRDMERLRKEEAMEEAERRRNGPSRSRLDSPPTGSASGINNIPLGPRAQNVPTGPKGQNAQNGRVAFVNGGVTNADYSISKEDENTSADDEELHSRYQSKQTTDQEKNYLEGERKWTNRERSRQAAVEREQDRENHEIESLDQRKQEQAEKEQEWEDEREAGRKSHGYYRDHPQWLRKRNIDKVDEDGRDEVDRRDEHHDRRREQANAERARGLADSFLDQQAEELSQQQQQQQTESISAPQPFKLSLGAAAQKAQASRAGIQRRTVAEVEGLLDDEEADSTTKRQLIPIKFEPTTGVDRMTDEEISQAVRSLAQEIPSDKDGLWKWEVKWDFMDDSVIKEKLRPFVEKKIVEYLGVQEEMLVDTVEEHLRTHGTAVALVEELEGALDDEAEDLVKKLWRMVIFFTECEKRGLPA